MSCHEQPQIQQKLKYTKQHYSTFFVHNKFYNLKNEKIEIMELTVMVTTPPGFWPKVRPSGLSTSASMVFEAPAVLAVI
jgi:hypothetical protein